MINWIVTLNSNPLDKVVGYTSALQAMRDFVVPGNVLLWDNICVYREAHPTQASPQTTVHFSNNNFQVDQINGRVIDYNYPMALPEFDASAFPFIFPVRPQGVNPNEKSQLLFLFAEAARSKVIQERFERAFNESSRVDLERLRVLANSYDDTCRLVGINSAHPTRPLTCADYLVYAGTLPRHTPKRDAIEDLCPTGLCRDAD